MICECCQSPIAVGDSVGSDFALCQDCWERKCSEDWWEFLAVRSKGIPVEFMPDQTCGSGSSNPEPSPHVRSRSVSTAASMLGG